MCSRVFAKVLLGCILGGVLLTCIQVSTHGCSAVAGLSFCQHSDVVALSTGQSCQLTVRIVAFTAEQVARFTFCCGRVLHCPSAWLP